MSNDDRRIARAWQGAISVGDTIRLAHRKITKQAADIEKLKDLVGQVVSDHSNPNSPYYNDCDSPDNLCDWCSQAKETLEAAK